jgi:hypothetical protein
MTDINTQDDFDTNHGDHLSTEALKTRDVTEGGIIGVVGGAVVGGLAGGPVGAVIGGIIGGAASATAVAGVDTIEDDKGKTALEYTEVGVVPPEGYVSDAEYQSHFASRYAGTDEDYGRHHPAYVYGRSLAELPEYKDHDWDTVQAWAITDWKRKNNEDWDKVKESVRYGWQLRRTEKNK